MNNITMYQQHELFMPASPEPGVFYLSSVTDRKSVAFDDAMP